MPATQIGQPLFLRWAGAGFGAELVRLSAMDAGGNSPGKRPTESGWQTMEVTPRHVAQWAKEHANVGLRTRLYPAVDIDVDDEPIARVCEAVFAAQIGVNARRTRSNSPRRALLYRTKEPFKKRVLGFQTPGGKLAKVEILGDGQQLAVGGLHPTGVAIEWGDEVPRATELKVVTEEQIVATLGRLKRRLEAEGCIFPAEHATPTPRRPFRSSDWGEDAELVEECLSRIDPDCDYEQWVKVGMALHAKDSGSRGFDAWDSWSSGGGKYPGRTELEKKWRTFKAGDGIHFGSLVAMSGVSVKKHAHTPTPPPTPPKPKAGNTAERMEAMARGDYEPAPLIPTGINALDKALGGGIPLNKMTVIAARTSHGKTATTVRLAVNFAVNAARKVVVLWCEDEEVEFDLRALAVLSHTPFLSVLEAYREKKLAPIWARVPMHKRQAWAQNCSTVRLDCPKPKDIAAIVGAEEGSIFLIDHLNEVAWGDGKKHELIGDGIRLIRRAAIDHKNLFIGMAQLNRDWDRRKAASSTPEKVRPCLSDIENSGQIEQVARVCVIAEKVMQKQGEDEVPTGEYRYHVFKPRLAVAKCEWHEAIATPDNPESSSFTEED